MTTTALVSPAQQQRVAALAKANHVRTMKGRVRRELSGMPPPAAYRLAADLLTDRDRRVESMTVAHLLVALPFVAHRKSLVLLRQAGIAIADRACRELTPRQREALAGALRERADSFRHRPSGGGS